MFSRFCWLERPSGLSQLQRSWSTLVLASWRRSIISLNQYSNRGCQANLIEVLDVFGALGIEVTEGQLRIENSSSNAGSRYFWANPGENLSAPKESAASEVLNIVSGPGIQVTADVLCSENSIACSRPHLDVLDLGQGVQSEAISSDTKGNTKEMKTGGKVCCLLYFSLLMRTAVSLQRILMLFCCVLKSLLRGWGQKGASRVRQAELRQTV